MNNFLFPKLKNKAYGNISDVEIGELHITSLENEYVEEIIRNPIFFEMKDEKDIPGLESYKKVIYKKKNIKFNIDEKRQANLFIYVDESLLKFLSYQERNTIIKDYVIERAAWFFSYSTRKELK